MQQADGVARRGIAEPRMEFLGNRGASHDRAALEHRNRQAGSGKVARADKAVVTAADNERVVAAQSVAHDSNPGASDRTVRDRCPPATAVSPSDYSSSMPAATVENPQST